MKKAEEKDINKPIAIDTFGTMATKPPDVSQEAWDKYHPKPSLKKINKRVAVRMWVWALDEAILEAEYHIAKDETAVPSFETVVTKNYATRGERFFDVNVAEIIKHKFLQFKKITLERGKIYYPKNGLKFMLAIASDYSLLKRPSYGGTEVIEYTGKLPSVHRKRKTALLQVSCGQTWCGTRGEKGTK